MEKHILIALPAFNEEKRIEAVIKSTKQFGKVFVFNNNSTDKTKAISENSGASVINVKEKGYEAVIFNIIDFFESSSYSKLVIIDGDGEVGVNSIQSAVLLLNKFDAVVGNRNYKKRFGERFICRLFEYFYGIKDIYCGFKCFTKKGINQKRCRGTFATSILKKEAMSINLDVDVSLRDDKSKLGEGLAINLNLIFSGIKGFLN